VVCNVPGYGTDSVAQHTFALILELTNHVGRNAASVKAGGWSRVKDFCYTEAPIMELAGKTLGIVGYGRIGQKTAEIARALGMRVIYFSPSRVGRDENVVSVEQIFSESDIVSLHCPLTKHNAGFIDMHLLSVMKPTAFLINTSRGQLINENDLADALNKKVLAAAALDVLSQEPPRADHPLIGLPNCLITPHNAWLSAEARQRIMDTTYNNIICALRGEPRHVVN
jgi:glycerate dehydrogenase